MSDYYVLDNDRRVRAVPMMEWARWLGKRSRDLRRVACTEIAGFRVSTVFLGLDHSFGEGPPVLWETMVFGEGSMDQDMDRCAGTWEQAEEMHNRMVKTVREALGVTDV